MTGWLWRRGRSCDTVGRAGGGCRAGGATRPDIGPLWPVGWADVGYSPSEIAIKEVFEETGIEVEVESLIAVFDGLRLGFARLGMYSLLFHCRMIGGELNGHPLETSAVGFFARDALPWPLAGGARWVDTAFAAIEGEHRPVDFDLPRTPPWRGDPEG